MISGQLRVTRHARWPPRTHYPCSLSPLPIIRLDKMETYAEILVTVGVTALLRPSLSSRCWPHCEPALQIVYGHWSIDFNWHFLPGPRILHLVSVIYILLLIKIHSGRRRERKKTKKASTRNKTVALRFRDRHTGTLWNGDVTRHYRVRVCVLWQCACVWGGGCIR